MKNHKAIIKTVENENVGKIYEVYLHQGSSIVFLGSSTDYIKAQLLKRLYNV